MLGDLMTMDSVVCIIISKISCFGHPNRPGLMSTKTQTSNSLIVEPHILLSLMVAIHNLNLILEIGRLFLCGKGDQGQLGNMAFSDEYLPFF